MRARIPININLLAIALIAGTAALLLATGCSHNPTPSQKVYAAYLGNNACAECHAAS